MSENTVQETVQEVATDSQNDSQSSNQDSELLREVMQKKERLQKAESRVAELEKKMKEDREAQLAEQEEYKLLFEETKAQLDSLSPKLEKYQSMELARKEKMLSEFSEEDREVFKDMDYDQLQVVHNKLISKNNNIPKVDNSTVAGYQGYNSLTDAARDVAKGKLDKSNYAKIKEAFASKLG